MNFYSRNNRWVVAAHDVVNLYGLCLKAQSPNVLQCKFSVKGCYGMLLWDVVTHPWPNFSDAIEVRAWWVSRDDIKWKHFPRYWPFVRGIHRLLVNSPNKGQWRGALMFSLICAWINGWVNNREAGDLRCHRAHYDVIVMIWKPRM